MEQNLFSETVIILDWLFFTFLALSIVYLLFFSIASLFYKTPTFKTPKNYTRFLLLIPAYKEDDVIIESMKTIVHQSYPENSREVMVIADRMKESTTNILVEMGVKILIFEPYDSLKAKALNAAMSHYENGAFDAVVILDADNMVEPSFLHQLNKAFSSGLKAIQTHRTAKKNQTDIAVLDGLSEEINNAIFRKGHVALGVSSALIGSGMAFSFDWFKLVAGQLMTAGEDKELEMILLRDKIQVSYLEDVVVLDQKVTGNATYFNQRRRWLAAQFYILGKSLKWLPKAILTANVDYVDKVIQWMMPPRVVVLGFTVSMSILVSFIDLTNAIKWWFLLLLCLLALGLAIPSSMSRKITLKSLLKLPVLFLLMVVNFFRTKGAIKSFIHTKKH